MMPIDSTTIAAGTEILSSLRTILEKRSKKEPETVSALTLVSRLQQHIDQLRARVLELETKNLELERRYTEQETWNARTADLELVVTHGGARVFRSKSNPSIFYCSTCHAKRLLIALQPGSSGRQNCRGCPAWFQIDPEPPFIPPEPPENPWSRSSRPRRY